MDLSRTIYVINREFSHSDTMACRDLVFRSVMSTWKTVYLNALIHELTYQFAILLAALLFILVGVPFQYCALAVPVTLLLLWVYVYSSHAFHAFEVQYQVKQPSSDKTGTWVSEAYEPWFITTSVQKNVLILSPLQAKEKPELHDRKKRIVGLTMVVRHKEKANVAWLGKLIVAEDYQRCGIGTSLVDSVAHFCYDRGYSSIQCVISQYQHAAKSFLLNRQFELESIYSKDVLASAAAYSCYVFLKDLLYAESRLNA